MKTKEELETIDENPEKSLGHKRFDNIFEKFAYGPVATKARPNFMAKTRKVAASSQRSSDTETSNMQSSNLFIKNSKIRSHDTSIGGNT